MKLRYHTRASWAALVGDRVTLCGASIAAQILAGAHDHDIRAARSEVDLPAPWLDRAAELGRVRTGDG